MRLAREQAGATLVELEVTEGNGGRFEGPEGITVANLEEQDPGLKDDALSIPTVLPDTHTLRVQSDTGNTFDVTSTNDGSTDLTCASADDGGCPPDGTWD